MDSLNYKYIHASKQKRIIALQDNRQMPTHAYATGTEDGR